MKIVLSNTSQLEIIQDLAYQIWPKTYGEILCKEQLDYMLESFYSIENLKKNIHELNHLFYLIQDKNTPIGFISIEHFYQNKPQTRIHKIYFLPETQGKGFGKKAVEFVEKEAKTKGNFIISLNVNRHNKALHFYQKIGFKIIFQEDIQLDHGYLMEDYLMEKSLLKN